MSVTTTRQGVQQVLRPQSFDQLTIFADMASRSALVPKDYQGKPENIMLAVQMGSEVGLAPMQALQNIAVINGRPAVWGDAMIGLCRASAVCQDVIEKVEGEGENMTAYCTAIRVGSEPVTASFSMADARKAQLAGKSGPWTQYPKRMLQMRARGFALRDAFPDVLRGLIAAEEAQDITPQAPYSAPRQPVRTPPTIDARAEMDKTLGGDDIPQIADDQDPDVARADGIIAEFQRATSQAALEEVAVDDDTIRWRDQMAKTRPDLFDKMRGAYTQRATDFRPRNAATA